MSTPKVVIVIAQCQHAKQSYGIRLEAKAKNQWVGDWAFAIQTSVAQREGYDRSEISGSFGFDEAYPGCPYCKAAGIFQCRSDKLSCWDGGQKVKCPWCGTSSSISGTIERLSAGGDR